MGGYSFISVTMPLSSTNLHISIECIILSVEIKGFNKLFQFLQSLDL